MNIDSENSSDDELLNPRTKLLNEIESKEIERQYQIRYRRFIFVSGVLLIVIGIIFWVQTESIAELFVWGDFNSEISSHVSAATNVRWFGSFFVLISTVFFSYLYMVNFNPFRINNHKSLGTTDSTENDEKLDLVTLLRSIDVSIEKGKIESVLSESERTQIISKISETVETQLNESLLNKIEDKYGLVVFNEKLSTYAETSLEATTTRLKNYADDLKSKASVNLAYGISATIIAIMLLMWLLFNATPPENTAGINLVFFYVSRLFLVFLVQGISIFFLSLYKSTLKNVLYLSNEITNHESKSDALTLALKSGNQDASNSILLSLANTERNFLIKKGESSILNTNNGQSSNTELNESIIKELVSKLTTEKK